MVQSIIDQRYRLLRQLGIGGFGTVWEAEEFERHGDTLIPLRRVALKVLHNHDEVQRRFALEAQALCRLSHPNVVTVYHTGRAPAPYLAMELVEGRALSQLPAPEPSDLVPRLRLMIEVAEALAHAHERAVLHRDLKPQNILVTPEGHAKVVDFGLSWLLTSTQDASLRIGTPGYLAPELIEERGREADHRADLYSFGATLHALFAGRSPFTGGNDRATVMRQILGEVALDPGLPHLLRPLVRQLLAADPMLRPPSAAQVADILRDLVARTLRGPDAPLEVRRHERVTLRSLLVLEQEVTTHADRGEVVRLRVADRGGTSNGPLGVFAYSVERSGRSNRANFDALCSAWVGGELHLDGALVRQRGAGEERYLQVDSEATVVLAPTLPVPVTDVVRVVGQRNGPCPTRYWVDQREASTTTRPLLIGAMIHRLAERMASSDPIDLAGETERLLVEHRWQALAAGLREEDTDRLRAEVMDHAEHLLAWWQSKERPPGRVSVELPRFSATLGLMGRADMLIEAETRVLVDFKTGKRLREDHLHQLRLYRQLFADGEQEPEGLLVYTQRGRTERLPDTDQTSYVRLLVEARNMLVRSLHDLSEGQGAALLFDHGQYPLRCDDAVCRFRRATCQAQTLRLGSMQGPPPGAQPSSSSAWTTLTPPQSDRARAWYMHFFRLLERERRSQVEVVRRALSPWRSDERVAAKELFSLSAIRPEGAGAWRCEVAEALTFHRHDKVALHPGTLGDPRMITGRVLQVSPDALLLQPDWGDPPVVSLEDRWYVEPYQSLSGQRAEHRALWRVMEDDDARWLRWLIQPQSLKTWRQSLARRPSSGGDAEDAGARPRAASRRWNKEQRLALQAMTAADPPPLLLISGPPGTGKTQVIAAAVAELVARGQRVLVAAHTNTALDTLVLRILQEGVPSLLRVGKRGDANAEIRRFLDVYDIEAPVFADTWLDRSGSLGALQARLATCLCVAATTHRCTSSPILDAWATARPTEDPSPPFDVVVVDEATQLSEPMALAALHWGARGVLVGDERQLPPIVSAPDATTRQLPDALSDELRSIGLAGLDLSLFERLQPWAPHVELVRQYRMNAAVQQAPNDAFYGGRLIAAPGVRQRTLPVSKGSINALPEPLASWLSPERPVLWIDSPGSEGGHHCGHEVRMVLETALALDKLWASCTEAVPRHAWLGIISPYRAQCRALRAGILETLGEEGLDRVEVETVDRFQGREKEALLVSLVSRHGTDFVMDARRMNVTLTRARSKLLIYGAPTLRERLEEGFGLRFPHIGAASDMVPG